MGTHIFFISNMEARIKMVLKVWKRYKKPSTVNSDLPLSPIWFKILSTYLYYIYTAAKILTKILKTANNMKVTKNITEKYKCNCFINFISTKQIKLTLTPIDPNRRLRFFDLGLGSVEFLKFVILILHFFCN